MKLHKVEPFNFFYCLATEAEVKEFSRKKKISIELPENSYGYAATLSNRTFVVIDGKKNKKPWEAIDTLIHESVHIFQAAVKFVGEDKIGIEMEAYSISTIATNLLKDYHAVYAQREKGLQT